MKGIEYGTSSGRLTVFRVPFFNLEDELAASEDIMIRLDPSSNGR
jgi:hypothetical protein